MPFDFYLNGFNLLIETDGEGHYIPIPRDSMSKKEAIKQLEKVQLHDKIKNQYCEKVNIPLIRVPYWERDNMEQFLHMKLSEYNVFTVAV